MKLSQIDHFRLFIIIFLISQSLSRNRFETNVLFEICINNKHYNHCRRPRVFNFLPKKRFDKLKRTITDGFSSLESCLEMLKEAIVTTCLLIICNNCDCIV